jgi:hypothetical protein
MGTLCFPAMKYCFLPALLALAGLLAGCSQSLDTTSSATWPSVDLTGRSTNPAGDVYPTANIGGQPRTTQLAGQTLPNLTFEGVLSAATENTATVVSMADYYDPQGARYDLLHVIAIFMWCPHCNNETYALVQIASWQASQRIAVVEVAMQGFGGASPTWAEAKTWAGTHNVAFPILVDGQGAKLGQYFPVGSVPVNIVVNPQTMEVLAVDVGEVSDIQTYEQGFLASP